MAKKTFAEIIGSKRPTLVDFSAEWCGPCKAMAPVLRQVKKSIGDNGLIMKVDVDKNPGLSQKLQIRGVPTFIMYKNGKQVWRKSGMQTANALENLFKKYKAGEAEEE